MTFKVERTYLIFVVRGLVIILRPQSNIGNLGLCLGMNEYELSQNKQLTKYVVRDLNVRIQHSHLRMKVLI